MGVTGYMFREREGERERERGRERLGVRDLERDRLDVRQRFIGCLGFERGR